MKCVVNWIPLRIRVRSKNTQPYLNTLRVSGCSWVVMYLWQDRRKSYATREDILGSLLRIHRGRRITDFRVYSAVQPIAERVEKHLEIMYKDFQCSTRRTKIFMGFIIYYLILIVNPMGRILVRWKSFRNNLEMLCHPICNWLYQPTNKTNKPSLNRETQHLEPRAQKDSSLYVENSCRIQVI